MKFTVKALALSVSALVCQGAHAQPLTASLKTTLHHLQNHSAWVLDGTAQAPLRQDVVKVRILKSTFTQKADGTFSYSVTDVCSTEGLFNVYAGGQSTSITAPDLLRVSCPTTLNGLPTQVNIGGALLVGPEKIFDQPEDVKALLTFLYAGNFQQAAIDTSLLVSAAATSDLRATSLLTALQPGTTTSCSSSSSTSSPNPPSGTVQTKDVTCTASMNEYFTAVVEIKD